MMKKNDQAVALVTGASSGIGEAVALRLAKAGYKVFGTSRRGVSASRSSFEMLPLDVTSDASVKTVVANDDVPSAPKGDEAKRRGVAGEILMWKVGAAKADAGGSLDEVIAVAQKAINATRSIGIGLSA